LIEKIISKKNVVIIGVAGRDFHNFNTKPNTRVYYNLQEIGRPNFDTVLEEFVKKHKLDENN
jgi:predicted GTPase